MTYKRKTNSYLESVLWFIRDRFKGVCSEPPSQTPTQEPSAANDTEEVVPHPDAVFMPALSRITQDNKNKDKARRVQADAASFSLVPSPWKRLSLSSLPGLRVSWPFCHMPNNSISRRI